MRSTIMAAVLAISTLFAAVPAMASENGAKNTTQYPVAAATFQAKVNAREQKAKERMEQRVAKLDATKAQEVRAKFDARMAKVNAEVAKVTADGTVTKDEAKQVHKEMGGHHHKGGERGGAHAPKPAGK